MTNESIFLIWEQDFISDKRSSQDNNFVDNQSHQSTNQQINKLKKGNSFYYHDYGTQSQLSRSATN